MLNPEQNVGAFCVSKVLRRGHRLTARLRNSRALSSQKSGDTSDILDISM
jgi:hypothetical protein